VNHNIVAHRIKSLCHVKRFTMQGRRLSSHPPRAHPKNHQTNQSGKRRRTIRFVQNRPKPRGQPLFFTQVRERAHGCWLGSVQSIECHKSRSYGLCWSAAWHVSVPEIIGQKESSIKVVVLCSLFALNSNEMLSSRFFKVYVQLLGKSWLSVPLVPSSAPVRLYNRQSVERSLGVQTDRLKLPVREGISTAYS
jgi:hypothetical protein